MTVEDYETRRILQGIESRHNGDQWSTFTAQLEHQLKLYAGRRTIQADMIRSVAELAYGHVAEVVDVRDSEREAELQKLVGVIERLEGRVATYRTRTEQLERMLSAKRTNREEREAAREDGETDVVISNGYVGWTVAGLEEIAYRLRSGGAVDDTPVEVDEARAWASVPAPNLVTLVYPAPAPPPAAAPCADAVVPDRAPWPRLPHWLLGLVVILGSVLVGVVIR